MEPATQCTQGTPWAVAPLVLQAAPCGSVPWLRLRGFFGYPGLSFLFYQVGALSLRGRKCCGIQYEAAWHLLQCPLHSCVSLATAWGPRYTHSSVPRICSAQSAKLLGAGFVCILHTQAGALLTPYPPLQGTEHPGFWVTTRSKGGYVTGCGHSGEHRAVASWPSSEAPHGQRWAPALGLSTVDSSEHWPLQRRCGC